jgi:hypothetical protein
MNKIFGDNFEYDSVEDLIKFLKEVEGSEAINVLEMAVNESTKKGHYNLTEAAVLFWCIQAIKNESNNTTGDPVF